MPRRNRPVVIDGLLLTQGADSISIGSRQWFAWLSANTTFAFQGSAGRVSARSEKRRGIPYWYGYSWRAGKLSKAYLGKSNELTQARLEMACARLSGQFERFSSQETAWSTGRNPPPAQDDLAFLPLAKVRPPALPRKLVARPRLALRINAPITLIIAPSGFGKSTLLNEWRQSCGIPVAWVSLDGDDNQPLRFWNTVVAALQTLQPNLTTPSATNVSELVVSLTNALLSAGDDRDTPRCIGLVLDDYHHIQDKEINDSLQAWIEHLPASLQLVISTHTKPLLSCGQLRAKGMLAELDSDDLRFNLEEGIGYLSQHVRGRPLAFGEMQAIVKRTEGWAAGLALAVLALDQPGEPRPEAFTGAHSYLREYFIESILYRQPPSVQEFLLETAILKHLTGPLCDAVTGRQDGAEMLAYLWQENLFLVKMEEPGWYRYHDLFGETLRDQLQRQLAGGIPRLHRRAAVWYRTQNAPADAVYHLLAIEAWEEAAALIEGIALRELEQYGEYSRLLRWLQQLPESVMQQHRTLLRVYVRVAALTLSRTEMNQFLTRVEMNIWSKPTPQQSADEQSVLTEIQRIRELWATGGAALSEISPDGEHGDVWQMLDGIVRLARLLRHEYAQAEALAQTLYELALGRGHLYVLLIAGGILAVHLLLDGYARKCEKTARQVLEQAMRLRGHLPEPASIALMALSQACYQRNELAHAHQLLLRTAEVDPQPSSSNMPIMEGILRAKIQSAQGDGQAALATLDAARQLQSKSPSGIYRERDLITYQALVCWLQGDDIAAERYLREAAVSETHSLAAFVRAGLLLNCEKPAAAAEILSDLVSRCVQGFYFEPILGARLLLARALFEQHHVNQARQVMSEAVRLAAPEGFVRPFLDYGNKCEPLLLLTLRTFNLAQDTQVFVQRVLRQFGTAPEGARELVDDEWSALSTAASITAREQQVLRLVGAGLSNREIAAQFSFSESTVKTHLKNIYRKLGVSSRTRAIAQARELKLV